jgi:hypothetical protein
MKNNFRIPKNTRFVIVLWYRNNEPHEIRIPTPPNNDMLRLEMLSHQVGFSEIRAVKAERESSEPSAADLNSLAYRFRK